MVYNLIMRSEANNQVYALSPELSFAFKAYVNEIDEAILGHNGDYQYLGDDWDVQFYGVVGGKNVGRLTYSEVSLYENTCLPIVDDVTIGSEFEEFRLDSLLRDFLPTVSPSEVSKAKRQIERIEAVAKTNNERGRLFMNLGQQYGESATGANLMGGITMNNQMNTINNPMGQVSIPGLKNAGRQLNGMYAMDMMTKLPAVNLSGEWYRFDKETKQLIAVNGMAMPLPWPAMVMPEQIENVQVGDLVFHKDEVVVVVKTTKTKITVMGADGVEVKLNGVKNAMMKDTVFVEKVTNYMEGVMDNLEDNPAMMMMAMGGMPGVGNGMQGDQSGMNPMAMMAMASMMSK